MEGKHVRRRLPRPVLPIAAGAAVAAMAIGGASMALTGNDQSTTQPAAAATHKDNTDRGSMEKRASRGKARPTDTASPSSKDGQDAAGKQGSGDEQGDTVKQVVTGNSGSCQADYTSTGTVTASGQKFDRNAMTAANMTLPFGTKVQITNPSNGKSVVVKINDSGPNSGDRCFRLTSGAYDKIASLSAESIKVDYQVLN